MARPEWRQCKSATDSASVPCHNHHATHQCQLKCDKCRPALLEGFSACSLLLACCQLADQSNTSQLGCFPTNQPLLLAANCTRQLRNPTLLSALKVAQPHQSVLYCDTTPFPTARLTCAQPAQTMTQQQPMNNNINCNTHLCLSSAMHIMGSGKRQPQQQTTHKSISEEVTRNVGMQNNTNAAQCKWGPSCSIQ